MKLTDKCWKLGNNGGVYESTVSECTRGDSMCREFFETEQGAWAAEVKRLEEELGRAENSVDRLKTGLSSARGKAKFGVPPGPPAPPRPAHPRPVA